MKYSMFIGRWQPWHNGHQWLIDQRLTEGKNVLICIRDVMPDEKNPYTFALKNSEFFIVTSDSTSMISECAITGNPIFIFHLPFKRQSKRIEKFHEKFQKLHITKKLDNNNNLIPWTYNSLNESKRIASIVKERIIKEN